MSGGAGGWPLCRPSPAAWGPSPISCRPLPQDFQLHPEGSSPPLVRKSYSCVESQPENRAGQLFRIRYTPLVSRERVSLVGNFGNGGDFGVPRLLLPAHPQENKPWMSYWLREERGPAPVPSGARSSTSPWTPSCFQVSRLVSLPPVPAQLVREPRLPGTQLAAGPPR